MILFCFAYCGSSYKCLRKKSMLNKKIKGHDLFYFKQFLVEIYDPYIGLVKIF
ncbi:hypothetical protein SAMN04487911_12635 [Arenibacter nanhaiticus]|uniref:Uncharacterized protein n=1 Tax=Arenibacter nanhaiticus TaxID=558155 RepID=A0A1M6KK98_9FLAO|nr:hypothetical protein SAMN04487911_12635 [Arenibacter nanhaiticus]